MKCQICGKKIEKGLSYRWWETTDAYLSEHRSCTQDDPEWAKLDKQKQEAQRWQEEYDQACKEFLENGEASHMNHVSIAKHRLIRKFN